MYSFQALADTTGSHVGFYTILIMAAIFLFGIWRAIIIDNDGIGAGLVISTFIGAIVAITYFASFHDVAPKNEQVTGTFVSFQAEGYNEQSGKTRADRHYMYVVYNVNGQNIILRASEGRTYPQTAILYKN